MGNTQLITERNAESESSVWSEEAWERSDGYEIHQDCIATIRACLNGDELDDRCLDYFNDIE